MEFEVEKNIPIPVNELPVDTETKPPKDVRDIIREKKFVDAVINGEKRTLTKAVQQIYADEGREITYKTASSRVGELRKRPAVMAILHEYEENAQKGLVEVADYSTKLGKMGGKEGAAYASVALTAHDKILDRVHGRAKQQVDVTTRAVTVNMDLTQALPDSNE